MVSSANFAIFTDSDVQSFVESANRSGDSTQPCGAPVLMTMDFEVMPLNFTTWGRDSRKSIIQLLMDSSTDIPVNFLYSLTGMIVLNAEL